MSIVFISPSKYIQGSGEMDNIGAYTAKLGKKALCVISKGGYARQGSQIEASFAGVDADVIFDYFNGECSTNEINRLVSVVKENHIPLGHMMMTTIRETGLLWKHSRDRKWGKFSRMP